MTTKFWATMTSGGRWARHSSHEAAEIHARYVMRNRSIDEVVILEAMQTVRPQESPIIVENITEMSTASSNEVDEAEEHHRAHH